MEDESGFSSRGNRNAPIDPEVDEEALKQEMMEEVERARKQREEDRKKARRPAATTAAAAPAATAPAELTEKQLLAKQKREEERQKFAALRAQSRAQKPADPVEDVVIAESPSRASRPPPSSSSPSSSSSEPAETESKPSSTFSSSSSSSSSSFSLTNEEPLASATSSVINKPVTLSGGSSIVGPSRRTSILPATTHISTLVSSSSSSDATLAAHDLLSRSKQLLSQFDSSSSQAPTPSAPSSFSASTSTSTSGAFSSSSDPSSSASASLLQKLTQQTQELDNLRKESEQQKQTIQQTQIELKRLKETSEHEKREFQSIISQYEAVISNLETQHQSKSSPTQGSDAEIAALLEEKQAALDRAVAELHATNLAIESATSVLDSLNQQLAKSQENEKGLEEQVRRLQSDLQQSRGLNAKLTADLEKGTKQTQSSIDNLRQVSTKEMSALRLRLMRYESHIISLETELNAKTRENQELSLISDQLLSLVEAPLPSSQS